MAVTELIGPTWLNVVWDGTADYELSTPILLRAVRFHGSAAGDKLTVMQEIHGETDSSLWPFFTLTVDAVTESAMFEPSVGLNPKKATYWIDYSKCTFSTPANVIIQFVYE